MLNTSVSIQFLLINLLKFLHNQPLINALIVFLETYAYERLLKDIGRELGRVRGRHGEAEYFNMFANPRNAKYLSLGIPNTNIIDETSKSESFWKILCAFTKCISTSIYKLGFFHV